MNCLIVKHKDFIFQSHNLRKNKSALRKIIKKSKNAEIKAIGELVYNLLCGRVYCSNYRKRLLKWHVASLRFLADKKISLKKKKSKLLEGGGVLLGTLIPLAISTVANLLGKFIKR